MVAGFLKLITIKPSFFCFDLVLRHCGLVIHISLATKGSTLLTWLASRDQMSDTWHTLVMELRKLSGKKRAPRLSVCATDASRCMAVVQICLVGSSAPDGRWEVVRGSSAPPSVTAPSVLRVTAFGGGCVG